jgi:hypothetical protein
LKQKTAAIHINKNPKRKMNVVEKEGKEEGRENLQGAGGQHSHLGELSASPSRPSSRPPITLEFLFSYTLLVLPHSQILTSFKRTRRPPTLCNQRLIQAKFRKSIPIRRKLHKKTEPNKVHISNKQQKTSMPEIEGARETRYESALRQYLGTKKPESINGYAKK